MLDTLHQQAASLITLLATPIVGKEAAKLLLQQLGYKPGDHFYVKLGNNQPHRCLILDDDYNFSVTKLIARKYDDWQLLSKESQYIRDPNGRKIWDDGRTYEDGFTYLKHQAGERSFASNREPKDIFIIPNFQGKGITSDESIGTYSIFVESDDGSFEQQLATIEDIAQATGLIPSQIIFSGGKSLHIYYRLSEFLTDEPTRKRLQRKLIALFRSDIQIQNSNREMRFAGFWRSSKNQYQSLLFTSQHQYNVDDFENRLDSLGRFPEGLDDSRWSRYVKLRNQKADDVVLLACLTEPIIVTRVESLPPLPRPSNSQRLVPQASPIGSSAIPLENFLSENDRELLYSGVGEGSRNSSAYQLACKLVARQERLSALNIPYTGDAKFHLEQFSASCTPPIAPQEVEQIWGSASKSNNTRLDDEYFFKKYSWWLRQHDYGEWRRLFKPQWQQVSPLNAEPDPGSYEEYEEREQERDRTEAAEAAARRREEEERDRTTDPAEKELQECPTPDDWKQTRERLERQNWLNSKKLTPTHIIDQEFFSYFSYWLPPQQLSLFDKPQKPTLLKQPPPNNLSFFGKSTTGSGKTTYHKVVKDSCPERWFSLGYRNGLLLQECNAWGLVHLQETKNFNLIDDKETNLAFCVHSLIHFETKMHVFNGANIVIDEVVSVIKCLLQDPQIKDRDKTLRLFAEALQRCNRLFCYDANLCDWAVEYINRLCPGKEKIVVSNIYKNPKPSVEFLLGSLKQETGDLKVSDNSPLVRALLNSRRWVSLCDSKKQIRVLAEILRKAGREVLEVCSDTMNDKNVKAFLKDADEWIKQNWANKGIDGCILLSPSAESGIDISIKGYFEHCYGLFFAVLDIDTCIQFLGRVRDHTCKFHVWSKEKGIISDLLPNSLFPRQIQRDVRTYINQLQEAVWSGYEGNIASEIIREFASKLLAQSDDIHFEYQSKLLSYRVYEEWNFRECLREAIENQGYSLQIVDSEPEDKAIRSELKETRDALYEKWSQQIYDAPRLTEEQFTKIQKKLSQSEQERASVRKHFLLSRLPGLDSSPIWSAQTINLLLFKEPGLIGQCELKFLFDNPEIAKLHAQQKWAEAIRNESLRHFDMLRDRYLKVKCLRELGLEWFLDPDNTWTTTTPQVVQAGKVARRKNVTNAIGKSPGKDTIKFLNGLLGSLGCEVVTQRVRTGKDEWGRVYQIQQTSSYAEHRKVILEALAKRLEPQKITQKITQRIFESKMPTTAYGATVPAVPLPADYSYTKKAGSGTEFWEFQQPEKEPTTTYATELEESHEYELNARREMKDTENNNQGATPTPTDVEAAPPQTRDALPLLKPGDEVEVYFYSRWCLATVLPCPATPGDFLVRVHIYPWDKTIDIYDAQTLRRLEVAAPPLRATDF